MTIIHTAVLKAALTHAAKLDVRYYLCGVYVDRSTGHIVATDGHRMLVARIPEGCWTKGESYIIPRETCEAAIKLAGKCTVIEITEHERTGTPDAQRPGITSVQPLSLTVQGIACKPIDGKYPDWRRVAPDKVTGEYMPIDPEYLLCAYKALALISGGKKLTVADLSHNGAGPAVLTRDGVDALIVLMPMRGEGLGDAAEAVIKAILTASLPGEKAAA